MNIVPASRGEGVGPLRNSGCMEYIKALLADIEM